MNDYFHDVRMIYTMCTFGFFLLFSSFYFHFRWREKNQLMQPKHKKNTTRIFKSCLNCNIQIKQVIVGFQSDICRMWIIMYISIVVATISLQRHIYWWHNMHDKLSKIGMRMLIVSCNRRKSVEITFYFHEWDTHTRAHSHSVIYSYSAI